MSSAHSSAKDEHEEVQEDVEHDERDGFVTVVFDRVAEDTSEEDEADDEMTSPKTRIQLQIDALDKSYRRKMTRFDIAHSQEVAPLHAAYAKISEEEARAYSDRVEATWNKTLTWRHNHVMLLNLVSWVLFVSMIICVGIGLASASTASSCWSNQYWHWSVPACNHTHCIAALAGKQGTATQMPAQCSSLYFHRWYQKNSSELCDAKKMVAFRGSWSEFFDKLRCAVVPLLIFCPLAVFALTEHSVYSLFYYDRRYRAVWLSEFSELRVRERRIVRSYARLLAFICVVFFSLGELCRQLNILDSVEMQWYRLIFCIFANVCFALLLGDITKRTFTAQIPSKPLVWQDGHWKQRRYTDAEILPCGMYPDSIRPYDENTVTVYWT
jgi:hypothetical protein